MYFDFVKKSFKNKINNLILNLIYCNMSGHKILLSAHLLICKDNVTVHNENFIMITALIHPFSITQCVHQSNNYLDSCYMVCGIHIAV